MTRCPDIGRLRAALDGEASVEAHVTTCADCRRTLAALRRDAAFAEAAVATLAPSEVPDRAAVEAAFAQVVRPAPPAPIRRLRLAALGRLVAAAACLAVAVTVVGTPMGRSAAAAFLAQFRTERLAVVTVDPTKAEQAFHALERLGTVSGESSELQPVADLAAAEQRTGFAIAQPDPATLPAAVQPTPEVLAAEAGEVRVTLSRDRAPDLPANFDGVTLVVDLPAMVVLRYPGNEDTPGLVIAEAGQVTADVEGGASLDEVRTYLLSLPDLPPETVAQLRAISDWRTTLPILLPAGEVAWRDTTVASGPALLFGDNSGLGSAVVWQRDGRIHGVAGALTAEKVTRIANGLR